VHDGLTFHVEAVEGQRIDRLLVTFQPAQRERDTGDEETDA
jgi:hypothetical protein